MLTMDQVNMRNQRVLIRLDLNVPLESGMITSFTRINKALPTLKKALSIAKKVIVMSHLGRPQEGKFEKRYSLEPIAKYLGEKLDLTVSVCSSFSEVSDMVGKLILLENVRFNQGEKSNCEKLSKKYASLCDIFVMDAFATAHREQASTQGVARYASKACIGPLLQKEIESLNKCFDNPERPVSAIVGGSKVSSKLGVLENLSQRVDYLIVGGGIANTFLVAANKKIGKSLYEEKLVKRAKKIMELVEVVVPMDVVVANDLSDTSVGSIKMVDNIHSHEMILDLGPETLEKISKILKNSKTIIWNGPLGVFEIEQFSKGTKNVSLAVAESKAFSAAGGGDTIAAIEKYNIARDISYISTGGGAFLKFLESGSLPALKIHPENHH